MVQDSEKITLPAYSSDLFIDRVEEIETLKKMLEENQPVSRALVVEGERGSGKTWLALHLHRTILPKVSGIRSILIGLSTLGEDYQPWGDHIQSGENFMVREDEKDVVYRLEELLIWIAHHWNVELPPNPSIIDIAHQITEFIRKQTYEKFVFILDSAFESDWEFLEKTEREFLSKLITLSNTYIVVSGRGRPYPWITPEISSAVKFGLEPFSEEQIQEQMRRLGLSGVLSTAEIRILGAGVPLCTVALAQANDRLEGLTLAADLLFVVVPARERPKIRPYFEALCILDGFREEDIPVIFAAYFEDPSYEQISQVEMRQIRDEMIETHLTRWESGKYVISEPLKTVLRNYLLHTKPEIWKRLHCCAFRYYQILKEKPDFKRFKAFLANKAKNHQSELKKINFRAEECRKWHEREAIQ
jgi:hypothetical protein